MPIREIWHKSMINGKLRKIKTEFFNPEESLDVDADGDTRTDEGTNELFRMDSKDVISSDPFETARNNYIASLQQSPLSAPTPKPTRIERRDYSDLGVVGGNYYGYRLDSNGNLRCIGDGLGASDAFGDNAREQYIQQWSD